MRAWSAFFAVTVVSGLVGTSGVAAPDEEPAPYRVVPVKGGRIEGTCRLAKVVEVPRLKQHKPCPEEIPSPRIVFDPTSLALADCVVSVSGVREGKDWPEAMRAKERNALIEIRRCLYVPQVSWVRASTQIGFANRDTDTKYVVHVFRGTRDVTQANFGVAEGRVIEDDMTMFLELPAKYLLSCDCSGMNMSGTILVVDHPYYAGPTGTDGHFVLEDVPPGEHEVVCWHEGMEATPVHREGWPMGYRYGDDVIVRAKATVVAGQTTKVTFTVPAPDAR